MRGLFVGLMLVGCGGDTRGDDDTLDDLIEYVDASIDGARDGDVIDSGFPPDAIMGSALFLDPSFIDFGLVQIGTSAEESARLANFGTELEVFTLEIIGTGFESSTSLCPPVLMPSEACELRLIATPTQVGQQIGEVRVSVQGSIVASTTLVVEGRTVVPVAP